MGLWARIFGESSEADVDDRTSERPRTMGSSSDAPQGLEYYAQRELKRQVRHFRKRRVRMRGAVHNPRDINDKLLTKFRFLLYLRGAPRIRAKTRVYQKVIDRLKVGEGIAEASYFEWFTFPPIPEPFRPDYLVGIQHLASVRPQGDAIERERPTSPGVRSLSSRTTRTLTRNVSRF